MIVRDFAEKMGMELVTDLSSGNNEISGVYVCDLLSWVMSHAKKGNAWITVHTHLNTVAVALLCEVSCIIVPEGIPVEEQTIKKASSEGIAVLTTKMSSYEICVKAHEMIGRKDTE